MSKFQKETKEYAILKSSICWRKKLSAGQQSKSLDSTHRALEQFVELLTNPDDVLECIMVLLSSNISIQKMDQVISKTLSKLAKTDIERLMLVNHKNHY